MAYLGPVDPEEMRRIQHWAREIGHLIGEKIGGKKNGTWIRGFALFLFSFSGPEFTYISNAHRLDMIKMLEEAVAKLKREDPLTSEKRN